MRSSKRLETKKLAYFNVPKFFFALACKEVVGLGNVNFCSIPIFDLGLVFWPHSFHLFLSQRIQKWGVAQKKKIITVKEKAPLALIFCTTVIKPVEGLISKAWKFKIVPVEEGKIMINKTSSLTSYGNIIKGNRPYGFP